MQKNYKLQAVYGSLSSPRDSALDLVLTRFGKADYNLPWPSEMEDAAGLVMSSPKDVEWDHWFRTVYT